jgi:branched-subunit amino acid transport protein
MALGRETHVPNILAMALGFAVAAIGVCGIVAPSVLLDFGRSLQTTHSLYFVAIVRVVFGAVLLWVAPASRTPRILRLLGAAILIAGVLTPLFGVENARVVLDWWSGQGAWFTRVWSVVAVVFGLFVIFTVTRNR